MTSLVAGKPVDDQAIHGTTPANKGIHWEYRVFGVLSKEYRGRLESFCTTPPESGSLRDRYLWSPGCGANIKIRRKKLKFKHLLQSTPDGFELWDEGKHLKFKFPLDSSTIGMLEKELCTEAPGVMKAGCSSADELTAGVSLFKPALKCIVIEKHRSRCSFLYRETPIQLEIADLTAPAAMTSIALECGSLEGIEGDKGLGLMREARDLLGLPGSFDIMGYVQFLEHLMKDDLS
jgi:hypothetical protein